MRGHDASSIVKGVSTMARGTFDDFTDKFGFSDGAATEPRDFQARDAICRGLNKLLKTTVAVSFDRPGMHNSCMIVFFNRRDGWTEDQYIHPDNWAEVPEATRKLWEGELPDDFDMDELISECYDEIDEGMDGEPCGQHVVARFS